MRFLRTFFIALLPLALVFCTNPPSATSYSEIVIDTYYPLSAGTFTSQFQYMELFSQSGVVSSADPWSSPTTGALASDISGSNPDGNQANFAYIDYKPAQPLPSRHRPLHSNQREHNLSHRRICCNCIDLAYHHLHVPRRHQQHGHAVQRWE